jgi:RHS repeat-associated protein
LSGIDEEWIPEERHRHGAWMSHRAYLAQSSLPQQAELRQVIQSRTPTVPDPISLVTAQAVSEQSPRVQRASWSEVDTQAQALNAKAKVQSLSATNGVTALAGQVLRLNGLPLAHVSMQVGTVSTFTDANGEFLLSGIASGNQVITINAATANRADATYGRFQYLFNIQSGKTNLLPFTVWMPKLDTRHAVHISSPTQQDTVISNPTMPGLSITLPAGTVVRDADGKIVTEVSLTPIPADQPPYPMPYAGVPLHYTIQPGGAVIQSVDGRPRGAVVRYPNYTSFGPGTPMQLFDYDPKGRGWYVYNKATVAANGKDIASDRDFLIYQFGTTSYSSGGTSNPDPNVCHVPPDAAPAGGSWGNGGSTGATPSCGAKPKGAVAGDPVDLQYGLFMHTERDLFVNDVIPINFTRTYRAQGNAPSITKSFGRDSTGPYEAYLVLDASGTQMEMTMADGGVIDFTNANGATTSAPYDQLTYQNTTDQGSYRNAYIQKNAPDSTFVVTFMDGRHWAFSAFSARLIWIEDRFGNRMSFARPNVNAYISRVTSPNGRYVDITYNTNGFISQLTDNLGRSFSYSYAPNTGLQTVTDPNGKTRQYGWDANNYLIQVTDPNGNVTVKNTMETLVVALQSCGGSGGNLGSESVPSGRVLKQTLADGSTFQYSYNAYYYADPCNGNQLIVEPSSATQVTDRRGVIRKAILDGNGNITSDTEALGKPEQQVTTSVYDPTTNLLTSMTDALNRQTTFQYDANSNLLQVTRLAGTANAVSASATYDPVFNQPLTLTDGNGNTTTLGYDGQGDLTSIKDALGHTTTIAYEAQGRPSSITNALGKTTKLTYSGADLSTITDPLNRQTQFITDAAGRVMTQIDALGNRTFQTWDSLNRLSQITDALGGLTKFAYDNDGNVLTQTDANNHATSFTYNAIGQVASKKDALLNLETSLYEPGGLLSQHTDRKGQISGVTYDNLGRVATIGFGATAASPAAYTSTVALTWDAGNRLTTIVDVQAGKTTTISRTFDGLNRMTSEVTEQGEVDYTYDNGDRRTAMVVKNGPSTARVIAQSVGYTYDVANRLTKITQAAGPVNNSVAQTVTFAYDNANRMTTQTVGSGPITAYTYTDADEIASITYETSTGTVITSGTYTYDAAGHRTSVAGGLATFVQASGTSVTGAAYNANNQLTSWNGKIFSYDKNGNLMSDGVNLYAWDPRNQLLGMSGGTTATFQYDGQGRRLAKTVAGTTTAFAYDGDNFVQELAGLGNMTTVNANLVTGGVDQMFMRGTGTGSTATLHWVLPEANNSTVIMADSSGNIQKSYAYDPYGNTTPSTGTDTNSQQYTGRENDGTGLYFYRNRYYMSGCMRFISEDPIGWASGQTNNYAYVGGNPVDNTDPFGLKSIGQCAIEHYGLESFFNNNNGSGDANGGIPVGLAVRGAMALGATPVYKPLVGLPVLGGASRFTNAINWLPFRTAIDAHLPMRILGTTRLFGLLGRVNIVLGVGLLAYDITSIGLCSVGYE